MSKVSSIYEKSKQTLQELASGSWPAFLHTAAWNYKYNFPNQVLIFAQRPDATACASMEVWNKQLQRRVNAGATGIALLEDAGDSLRLSYIFDVSDTHSPVGAQVPIWKMTPEKEEDVRIALANAFLPGSHPYMDDVAAHLPTNFYYEIVHYLCDQLAEPSVKDLLDVKASCEELSHLNDSALAFEFKALLSCSVTSVLMDRLGLEADIDPSVWESAKRFSNPSVMAILGQTTQSLARQGLDIARMAVRKWDREHKEEKVYATENELSAGRGVSDPGSGHSGTEASEQVRQAAEAVSAGAQAESVHRDDADRDPDGAPVQHRTADPGANEPGNVSVTGEEPGSGQSEGQLGLAEAHELPANASGGESLSGDDLRLTDEEGNALSDAAEAGLTAQFPSIEEQTAIVSAVISPLRLTQDERQSILEQVFESHDFEEGILNQFREEFNSEQMVSALRETFGQTDLTCRIQFSDKAAAVTGQPQGLGVEYQGQSLVIPWADFAAFVQKKAEALQAENVVQDVYKHPASSAELSPGQTLRLSGNQYLVTAVSDSSVSLQDIDHPIFTQTIERNILDLLLRAKEQRSIPEPSVQNTEHAEVSPNKDLSEVFPQPVENSHHIPEPLIDHPELIAGNVSQDERKDKVVLADLLMHFIQYRSVYAEQTLDMSTEGIVNLSDHDLQMYQQERAALEDMAASSEPEDNRRKLQEVIAFYTRWFIPFSELTPEHIQKDMNQVLEAAQDVLTNWDQLVLSEPDARDEVPADSELPEESVPVYSEESFHVGDFYEDAYGRGVISAVTPEQYGGAHKALFSFSDPDAPAGSPGEKGYVMELSTAIERLSRGEATLTPAMQWQAKREAAGIQAPSEPSLFDFSFDPPAEPLPEAPPAPVSVNAIPSAEASERINYKIPVEEENLGGPKARFQSNIAAIRLLKQLEGEGRLANTAEQEILARYVGWGGLQEAFDASLPQWKEEYALLKDLLTEEEYDAARESTLTAFYTPPAVTEAIFTGLRQLGFERGNILDPCCGTGNFFGMLPEDMQESRLYGVELDSISGRISRQLYQNANIVIDGYEKTALPDSMFDVAVGNVPFGNYQLRDRRYDKEHFLIHDYFFAKTLDKVRPGGIVAFVTSKGTMDKKNDSVRKYIAQRAELLGAIRLPEETFKTNAGTEAVADILFLKKREHPIIEEPYWVGLDRQYLGGNSKEDFWGPEINAYFADNPEMVLGDLVYESGPHGQQLTCKAREGEDLRSALQQAIKNIEGSIGTLSQGIEALDAQEQRYSIPADPSVRNFSYAVVDGDIYFREDSLMFKCDMNKTAEQRVKGMVGLRDITRDLIQAQLDDAPEEQILALQERLNTAYDAFSQKHGIINSRANERAFSDDSSYYLLCSLENLDDEGNFVSKADMFHKRTIGQHTTPEHVETAHEALAVSLGERAVVDLKYMSQLSGLPEEKLVEDLQGLIFPLPDAPERYEISSLYLSGNVREKLLEAQEAAKEDPRFLENVRHLEKVMPEPLEPGDISVRLGSTWIPAEDYKDFLMEFLNLPEYCRRYMDVQYEPVTDSWSIANKRMAPYSSHRYSTYGTSRLDAVELFEKSLNLREAQVFDTVEVNGETRRVLNSEETIAAQEKQQKIKDLFKEWIWKDPDRRERICRLYNEKFNSIVPPTFSQDLVQFHGLNPLIELAPHQKESVARILYSGNTLLAHCVGAGKTWTMTAAAMEGKYLGLCNKSMVVVPNHLIGQWAAAIYEAYPQAHVLASTEKDFEPANRKKFCSRIATGDYDIVVIGHSHFEKIPLSAERQEATIRKEMDDIIDSISDLKAASGERLTIKKLEAAKKSLQTKLDKLHNSKKRDDVVTFEELGVDRLFVDESHNYKNLFLSTKMHNVAGISQTDSQKASDMFVKCRYMDELTGGMGVIHASGSPISNTMAELYTTQRYLQYDLLQKMGLSSFDAWASTFGETVVALELAPEGNGYRPRTRFSKFFNLPELMNLYKQVADIRTADMLNLPVPAVEYKTVVLKPSEEQKDIVRSFGERAEKIRKGGVDSRKDNMLCITNEGRKVALDQRLIDPTLPDNPNSKTAACAENILQFYHSDSEKKLTQLVFCDLSTPKSDGFDVYNDLKDKLMAKGIPAEEIRFIHEANTVPQKEALFAKVRSGAVRVLMGSTGKMGTGTNVQDRLIAGHDLDAPWRPSDLEQRAGRVIRRGNSNDKVFMLRYVTEGTFDSYMYQLLEIKQRFIDQILSSKNPARSADDIDGAALNYAEIKALSSGDPRIKEKVTLETEISRLEVLKNRHVSDMFYQENQLRKLPLEIQGYQERIAALKEDYALASSQPSRTSDGKLLQAVVKGQTYEKQGQTGEALLKAVKKLPKRDEWVTLGSLRGFPIQGMITEGDRGTVKSHLSLCGKCRYSIEVKGKESGQGIMLSLNNVLDTTIPLRLKENRKHLAASQTELESIQKEVGKPFAEEALLQEKKARLAQLDAELNLEAAEKKQDTNSVDVEVVKPEEDNGKRSLDAIIASAAQRSGAFASTSPEMEPQFSHSR